MIMTVRSLGHYLNQLLDEDGKFDVEVVNTIKKKAKDSPGVTAAEREFLADNFLKKYRHRFDSEATAHDLERFLVLELECENSPIERLREMGHYIPQNLDLLVEAFRGQVGQLFKDGTASSEEIKKVREKGRELNFRGNASIAYVSPQAKVDEVEAALKKTIHDIDGFAFLSNPLKGKARNEHTVLIKVGVNWGQFYYPTVTSSESVYAVTKMCLQEAKDRRAKIRVIIGDESGIENRLWGGTTTGNFEHTGILQSAVLAGLEHAASLEAENPADFKGAGEMLKRIREGYKVTKEKKDTLSQQMVDMASQAGVDIKGFGEQNNQEKDNHYKRIPIPGADHVKHFKEGILIPRIVADEVTDIINLPKPPGRHIIMGNTGLTGALKNHVGLLRGEDRSPALHGEYDRLPDPQGQEGNSYVESLKAVNKDKSRKRNRLRQFAHSVDWREHGPGMGFHEKIVEIYLAFKDKERFSATDMRQTVSSFGPDIGDTIDIGVVIAAKDPVTLDALAGAFLKRRYEKIGSWFDALKWGGDSFTEYLAGRTWLRSGNPFDLMSHIAANSYGIGPIDLKHMDLRYSGFTENEIDSVKWYLMRRDGLPSRNVKLYSTIGLWAGVVAVSLAVTVAAAWAKSTYSRRR
jgi:uncharacterized protein (DUF362 family)